MGSTHQIIQEFEEGLNANHLELSEVKAQVLGYGEISTVFQINGLDEVACKRIPLFNAKSEAEVYEKNYNSYCDHLKNAGLTLAKSHTEIFALSHKPVTLYIVQEKLSVDQFAHKLINTLSNEDVKEVVQSIVREIKKIWDFNDKNGPGLEIALDGQLSNWVRQGNQYVYIDTSTPLFKIDGKEQLDPELFLKTAPSFLRWIIRLLFLQDVMDRYYDLRSVLLDLAANLTKEQRQDLIPSVLEIINDHLGENDNPIDEKEVEKYYKEDKLIWTLFLAFRRFDRWIQTKLFRRSYEYTLPGKIKR